MKEGGWFSTEIREDEGGWWCGGQCWGSLKEAEEHQRLLTQPTTENVTQGGEVQVHTEPVLETWGYRVNTWYSVEGSDRVFYSRRDAINYWKRGH